MLCCASPVVYQSRRLNSTEQASASQPIGLQLTKSQSALRWLSQQHQMYERSQLYEREIIQELYNNRSVEWLSSDRKSVEGLWQVEESKPWDWYNYINCNSSKPLWEDPRSESRHRSQEWPLWPSSGFARGTVWEFTGVVKGIDLVSQFESQEWSNPTYKSYNRRGNPIVGVLAIEEGNNCLYWWIAS